MQIIRRKILTRLIRAGALITVFALMCTGGIGCTKKETAKVQKKETVTMWCYWDIEHNRQELANLIDSFNESQEKIEVTVQYIPDEDFKKELALSLANGTEPDIALVDSSDFRFFNYAKRFVELTDAIPELSEYLPVAMEPCTEGKQIYGMPFGVDCTALFYNEAMLEAAGVEVPATWAAFTGAAKKLTASGHYGFGISAVQSEEAIFSILPIMWSKGGNVDTLDTNGGADTFEMINELAQAGAISRQCVSMTFRDIARQFADEKLAMMINTSMNVEAIREENPNLNFDVTYLPTDGEKVSVVGGEIFGVTEGEQQEAAIQFLKYIADPERMASYIDDFGFLAAREDVMQNQYQDDEMLRTFFDIFQVARSRDFTQQWPQISNIVAQTLEESIMNERNQQEVLTEAAQKIRTIQKEASVQNGDAAGEAGE